MPELPEVETTRLGIEPHLLGRPISAVVVRNPALRQPIPADLGGRVVGCHVRAVTRRAKYLVIELDAGMLLVHLGMSGSLRVVSCDAPPETHDHLDLCFGESALRLRDPRRFGLVSWHPSVDECPQLMGLGIEPLGPGFDGDWLFAATRGCTTRIKLWLMDGRRIAGIGNIYASESLFRAGIDPRTAAASLGPLRCRRLAESVRATLQEAIAAGGSTLRDFTGGDGRPGYFQHHHLVYDRAGETCPRCAGVIRRIVLGQRATFYCPRCQRR